MADKTHDFTEMTSRYERDEGRDVYVYECADAGCTAIRVTFGDGRTVTVE